MDSVVNVFALLIVFVFDPLAVALIVGYNRLALMKKVVKDENKKYEIYKEVEENKSPREGGEESDELVVNVTAETDPLDKEGAEMLDLESKQELDFQPPVKTPNNWGLGRNP